MASTNYLCLIQESGTNFTLRRNSTCCNCTAPALDAVLCAIIQSRTLESADNKNTSMETVESQYDASWWFSAYYKFLLIAGQYPLYPTHLLLRHFRPILDNTTRRVDHNRQNTDYSSRYKSRWLQSNKPQPACCKVAEGPSSAGFVVQTLRPGVAAAFADDASGQEYFFRKYTPINWREVYEVWPLLFRGFLHDKFYFLVSEKTYQWDLHWKKKTTATFPLPSTFV